MNAYLDLLRSNPNFRKLWLARVVSNLGDWFNLLASAALITRYSDSGTAVSGLFLASYLPIFLASPVAGMVADRFNRRTVLIVTDLLRAVIVLCYLFIRGPEDLWLFYVLAVLQFTASAFFSPAQSALIPNLVDEKDLLTANALDATTWSTMLAVGALLGGITTATLGVQSAYVLDSLTFLLSAWLVRQVVLRPKVAVPPMASLAQTEPAGGELHVTEAHTGESGWSAYAAGLRYLAGRPFLMVVALTKAGAAIIWGLVNVIEVPLAERVFPLGENGSLTLGLIYAAIGIGTAFGPLLIRRWFGDERRRLIVGCAVSFGLLSLAVLGMALSPSLPILLTMITLRGAGSGALWVFSAVLLQSLVPDRVRGRVFAFDFAAYTLMQSAGTVLAGVAQDQFGLGLFTILFYASLLSTAIALLWTAAALATERRFVPTPAPIPLSNHPAT